MIPGRLAIEHAEADRPLLARLEAAAFAEPWSEDDLAPLLDAGAGAAFVARAEADGRPLGFALFQILPAEVELLRIGVVPEQRGRGVAGVLLALDELSGRGFPVCHLEVRADNLPAIRLYERFDFRLAGRRRGYYSDGTDALRFRREQPLEAG
jgi:ribosomal-protein-alanine N-acetyltransferase